jgi:hypothetical protein
MNCVLALLLNKIYESNLWWHGAAAGIGSSGTKSYSTSESFHAKLSSYNQALIQKGLLEPFCSTP